MMRIFLAFVVDVFSGSRLNMSCDFQTYAIICGEVCTEECSVGGGFVGQDKFGVYVSPLENDVDGCQIIVYSYEASFPKIVFSFMLTPRIVTRIAGINIIRDSA